MAWTEIVVGWYQEHQNTADHGAHEHSHEETDGIVDLKGSGALRESNSRMERGQRGNSHGHERELAPGQESKP